jgi:hypothetical protein
MNLVGVTGLAQRLPFLPFLIVQTITSPTQHHTPRRPFSIKLVPTGSHTWNMLHMLPWKERIVSLVALLIPVFNAFVTLLIHGP